MNIFLWAALPYLTFAVLIGGLVWRYRYDQFHWTSRSSQLYESKILRVASPLFHFAMLAVIAGHIMGLVIPKRWTDAMGISQHNYHLVALIGGAIAGIAVVIGLVMLVYRRLTNASVRKATTVGDKVMYVILLCAVGLGMNATLTGGHYPNGEEHNYRETVSIWFRSLFTLQPDIDSMVASTWQFQTHVIMGLLLIAIIPFTRLVHIFAAPIHYLFRPYIVYRSRSTTPEVTQTKRGSGWDPVGTFDNEHAANR
ncbi:nitrate reductase subunit gamma [Corynebacterium kutscheri]|uniref:Nitrate reductase-like protein NarX n=1 Tax=Corynebacterium kutscheri TaxID=35755 RepID=A0A0F6R237_9CORY|nr:respiratory nitrate reductase subunit gamma [Corynebacterium kutscheri]AKE42245.1 respiratory nitrate reductase, gamma subunit [Corynebacterium kutscheri]VEH05685.1 nitrate reductase subunit gamma [Corynebacterium kutscheri]VEH10588.1 nitrate reductase subunit gamma [Corynebacterium kutscheri]VEH81580.1 nitrate reductase subunit gamma [Corynebacterium kutscheri]